MIDASLAENCDERVCLSVCLSAGTSQQQHIHPSPDFLHLLPMALAQFSSGIALRYVMYRVFQKTDPLVYFDDNFGKYGPILTIFSLLQQEIYEAQKLS